MRFRLIDTATSALWDYGWFDLSRFEVLGPREERGDPMHVVRAFFRDPISSRSFCHARSPWGAERGHHGPFLHPFAAHEWARAVTPLELRLSTRAVVTDRAFSDRPSREQLAPLEAWLARVEAERGSTFVIDVPPSAAVRVDWDFVWLIFREYVHVDAAIDTLTIAVIGCD